MTELTDNRAIHLAGIASLLQVFNMPASLNFYRDIPGFKTVQSSGQGDDADWGLLTLNDIGLMLNTVYEKHNRPRAPDSKHHDAHCCNLPGYKHKMGRGLLT
jgi:catechol 2,3-dioxygenase-like lactoylglutathione lyase family enzyme